MISGNNAFRKHDAGKEYPACYFCRCSCFVPESDKSSSSVDFRNRLFGLLVSSAGVWSSLTDDELDARPLLEWA